MGVVGSLRTGLAERDQAEQLRDPVADRVEFEVGQIRLFVVGATDHRLGDPAQSGIQVDRHTAFGERSRAMVQFGTGQLERVGRQQRDVDLAQIVERGHRGLFGSRSRLLFAIAHRVHALLGDDDPVEVVTRTVADIRPGAVGGTDSPLLPAQQPVDGRLLNRQPRIPAVRIAVAVVHGNEAVGDLGPRFGITRGYAIALHGDNLSPPIHRYRIVHQHDTTPARLLARLGSLRRGHAIPQAGRVSRGHRARLSARAPWRTRAAEWERDRCATPDGSPAAPAGRRRCGRRNSARRAAHGQPRRAPPARGR